MEGAPFCGQDAVQVKAGAGEQGTVFVAEVLTNHTHETTRGIVCCGGQSGIGGRATQEPLALCSRSLNRIVGEATDHHDVHETPRAFRMKNPCHRRRSVTIVRRVPEATSMISLVVTVRWSSLTTPGR